MTGRCAPWPAVIRNDKPRLNPVFVEWTMGLPEGHVTGHGLKPAQELKMLGNGVVPQQAVLALSLLGWHQPFCSELQQLYGEDCCCGVRC